MSITRHEVTITLRVTIPGEHEFLNMKAIADDVAGAAFVQLENFTDDHGLAYENASSSVAVTQVDPECPSNPLSWPFFEIPEWLWENNGEDDDPTGRLNTCCYINRTPFHVEARAVVPEADRKPTLSQELVGMWDDDYDHVVALAGESGEPFYTHTIRGREYLVVAYPFYD